SANEFEEPPNWTHELVHLLTAAPDLYDHNDTPPEQRLRFDSWGLMGNDAASPIDQMSAFEKWRFGRWLEPVAINRRQGSYVVEANEVAAGTQYSGHRILYRLNIDGRPDAFLTV